MLRRREVFPTCTKVSGNGTKSLAKERGQGGMASNIAAGAARPGQEIGQFAK